jgi:hypothetical protein
MKSSNLAERLEQFEATLRSLDLRAPPRTGLVNGGEGLPVFAGRRARRARASRIEVRDQGLRPFRVF